MREQSFRSRISVALVLLLCASALNAVERSGGSRPDSSDAIAQKAISLLLAGDFDEIAKLHHYPTSYAPAKRKEDMESVAHGLRFTFFRAGTMSEVLPLEESREFYFVAMGGGDPQYWQSISPYGRREYPYRVTFSNFGPAMVKVIVLDSGPAAGRELVGIELGLSTKLAGSKGKLVRLSVDLLKEMKIATPPNIEELVAHSMERHFVVPADSLQ